MSSDLLNNQSFAAMLGGLVGGLIGFIATFLLDRRQSKRGLGSIDVASFGRSSSQLSTLPLVRYVEMEAENVFTRRRIIGVLAIVALASSIISLVYFGLVNMSEFWTAVASGIALLMVGVAYWTFKPEFDIWLQSRKDKPPPVVQNYIHNTFNIFNINQWSQNPIRILDRTTNYSGSFQTGSDRWNYDIYVAADGSVITNQSSAIRVGIPCPSCHNLVTNLSANRCPRCGSELTT